MKKFIILCLVVPSIAFSLSVERKEIRKLSDDTGQKKIFLRCDLERSNSYCEEVVKKILSAKHQIYTVSDLWTQNYKYTNEEMIQKATEHKIKYHLFIADNCWNFEEIQPYTKPYRYDCFVTEVTAMLIQSQDFFKKSAQTIGLETFHPFHVGSKRKFTQKIKSTIRMFEDADWL